jgi:FkbM family methyltransferase
MMPLPVRASRARALWRRAVVSTLRCVAPPRGAWRLASLLLKGSLRPSPFAVAADIPIGEVVRSRRGPRLELAADPMFLGPYLFADYEPSQSRLVTALARPGGIALDVGAAFGWYSALYALAAPEGRVHAFEPMPAHAEMARRTLELSSVSERVSLVTCALGDTAGAARLFAFANLPAGHASLHDLGRDDAVAVEVQVTTVDAYLAAAGIGRVDLLKVDAEGHETAVFAGADVLLRREDGPVVLVEVNTEALAARGLDGASVFSALRERGYTRFWSLDVRPYEPVDHPFAANADYVAARPIRVPEVEAAIVQARRTR